jgi:hypothetical protein
MDILLTTGRLFADLWGPDWFCNSGLLRPARATVSIQPVSGDH